MNLRLDHKINRDMSLQIVGYYGYDRLKLGLREFDAKSYGSTTESDTHFFDENSNRLAWGNWGVIGNYDYRLNRGMLRAAVYYSKYSSNYRQEREYQTDTSDPSTYEYSKSHTSNSIADIGAKVSYIARLQQGLHAACRSRIRKPQLPAGGACKQFSHRRHRNCRGQQQPPRHVERGCSLRRQHS